MSTNPNERWEAQLHTIADDFTFPPTPDLTAAVAEQLAEPKRVRTHHLLRPIWVALLLLVLGLVGTLSIPAVRATVLEWLQIGTVRIWLVDPSPTATNAPISVAPTAISVPIVVSPTTTPMSSVLDIAGETTLLAAQAQVDFPIRLPTQPADLGEPEHVYLQQAEGDMVILVWMRPDQPQQVRMSLHLLGPGAFVWKMQPPDIVETEVNDAPAFWLQGPYYIKVGLGESWGSVRLVDGHVLIWSDGDLTYRLESDLPLTEAIQIAETLDN